MSSQWPVFVVGLVVAAAITLRQWAIHTLGRLFTADVGVQQGQPVIDHGPSRWLRHPSYTGLITFFLGLGLALTNWATVAVLAMIPTIGLVIRVHADEHALLSALGEPYRRFAETRPRLMPGIW